MRLEKAECLIAHRSQIDPEGRERFLTAVPHVDALDRRTVTMQAPDHLNDVPRRFEVLWESVASSTM
jgi:hypothetical protein